MDSRGGESTQPFSRQPRRYRITGPLADAAWRIGVVDILTRELPQGAAELTVAYLARRCHDSPEDLWREPDEPMAELSVDGQQYDPVTTVFSHGDDYLQVQGHWRFHVPRAHVLGEPLEIRLVSGDDDESERQRSHPIQVELWD